MSRWHRVLDMHTHEAFFWRIGMVSTAGIVVRASEETCGVFLGAEVRKVKSSELLLADHPSNEAFVLQMLVEMYPRGRIFIDREYSCVNILHCAVTYTWYFGDQKGSLLNALCVAAFEDKRRKETGENDGSGRN